MLREALHILVSAVLYRPANDDETRTELATWEATRWRVSHATARG